MSSKRISSPKEGFINDGFSRDSHSTKILPLEDEKPTLSQEYA